MEEEAKRAAELEEEKKVEGDANGNAEPVAA